MKAYSGVEVELHTFVTSVQVLDKWSPSRHVRLHLRFQKPLKMELDGFQMQSETFEEERISCLCHESKTNSSVIEPLA